MLYEVLDNNERCGVYTKTVDDDSGYVLNVA